MRIDGIFDSAGDEVQKKALANIDFSLSDESTRNIVILVLGSILFSKLLDKWL